MVTILRELSYSHQWLYDGISDMLSLSVGGRERFRQIALQNLTISSNTRVLDLCCGCGQTTEFLVKSSNHVIVGLDASPLSLNRAKRNIPQAICVEAFAENMPFENESFDLVHISESLHEIQPRKFQNSIREIYRVLRNGGILTLVDFQQLVTPMFITILWLFCWLFEMETAWKFLQLDC